jgi:S-adenosyl-L-methionine hydrolase (adenosine-forming)
MAIITLTSDMGLQDYYVGAVKGAIYSQLPDAIIVDITHNITPFDIAQAAFVVRNAFSEFPEGTVHIIGVNPELDVKADIVHVIVHHKGHYFIGADNGMFSLMFDRLPESVYEITISQDSDQLTFPTRHVFVKAACHLARGGTPSVIGKPRQGLKQRILFRPVVENHLLKGSVIYVDGYGNAITNITRQLFKEIGKGRDFEIIFARDENIRQISNAYNDVSEGEKLALFGSSGFLELAINRGTRQTGGSSSSLFAMRVNAPVRIEFS